MQRARGVLPTGFLYMFASLFAYAAQTQENLGARVGTAP